MNYYELLKKGLDEHKLPYREIDDSVIEIHQGSKNLQSVRIVVGFNEPTDCHPWLKCYALGHFDDDKYAAALMACNDANNQFRWVRFYVDDDHDVVAETDAIVSEDSVFDEIVELIARMIRIVDDACPAFMKVRWA